MDKNKYKKIPLYIFLSKFLPTFLPDEMVEKLLNYEGYKYFEQAFTHPEANPNFHYQKLEILGDACIKPAFILYIFRKYPEIKNEGEITILVNYFLSKEVFSKTSDKYGFSPYIRLVEDMEISDNEKEDVFESFVGALQQAGDKLIGEYVGQMLVRKFIFMVFDDIKIDTKNLNQYRSPIQILKEMFFDPRRTDLKWKISKPAEKKFLAKVMFEDEVIGSGFGEDANKARNNAARDALLKQKLI